MKQKHKVLFLFISCLFSFDNEKTKKQNLDGAAAVVGENIILKSDLYQVLSMTALQQNIDPTTNPKEFISLQKQVLQSLIDQKVIIEMARLDSVIVDEKNVDSALDQQIQEFITRAGGKENAEKTLGQSIKSFRREFWKEMHERLISEKYQFSLVSNIFANRKDVVSFYKTYKDSLSPLPALVKANHILVKIGPGKESKKNALEKINNIQTKLLNGVSTFEEMASTHSQDLGSRARGGSLGFVERGSLLKEFESVAFTLKPKIVSPVVKTVLGYHLIRVNQTKGDKVDVSHILIKPEISIKDEKDSYIFALTLKDSIKTFFDFERLALLYSEDIKTKNSGGSLGWINPKEFYIEEISGFINNELILSSCSNPIKSSIGYHLLWVSEIKKGGRPTLKDHWNEIENIATNRKKMLWFNNWMEESKKNVFIRVFD